jgi:PAS domain S-box-containing protein
MESVERSRRTPGIAPRLIGALVALAGALVLAGWAFDVAVLKSPLPGSVSMKPNAALGFVLAGLALLASSGSFSTRSTRQAGLGRLCALMLGLLGLLSLGEYLTGTSFGIDQLLFVEPGGAVGTSYPGRMAPDTALCFVLLGVTLWLTLGARESAPALLLAVTFGTLVATLGLAALLSHSSTDFGAPGWWGLTMMAVHTAGLFVILGIAASLLAWRQGALPWALGWGTTAAFASGLAVLVFVNLTTNRGIVRMRQADHRVAQAEGTQQTLSRLLTDMARAQSDARGYLMTGDDQFLEAFAAAMADCRAGLAEVDRLMAADPDHLDAAELDRAATEALAWWSLSVDTHGANRLAAEQRSRVSHGQLLMERVRAAIGRIQESQERSLSTHRQASRDLVAMAGGVVTAGTLVSLGIFLAALLAVDRAAGERKRAEAEAATVIRTSLDAFWFQDLTGRILDANEAFCRMLGYTRDELLRLSIQEIEMAETPERLAARGSRTAETGGDRFETRYRRKDGTLVDMDLSVRYVPSLGERLFVFARDVTKEKESAARLEKAAADLSTSNRELEQFAYVASHDLQEPLRMVSSYTQLLAERYRDQLDDKARQYIDYAVDGAVRMQRLINDLLVYSRVHSRGAAPVATDSHAVLGEALANLAAAIGESGALVTNDDLPTLPADPTQLLQLFQNLIANAIKFAGPVPPRIHVSARDLGREWLFSVRDNGIGIDPQYASRLFVIFQRLHTRQEYPGTGIGLALCRRVVERHGGRIWFESEPGQGSTFFFTFPK